LPQGAAHVDFAVPAAAVRTRRLRLELRDLRLTDTAKIHVETLTIH